MRRIIFAKKESEESVCKLRPMRVRQIFQFSSTYAFPVCPACRITLEREYQHYCDRCGQCLDWEKYEDATVLWRGEECIRSTAFDGKREDDDAEESEDAW